jgi:hypothetical protein
MVASAQKIVALVSLSFSEPIVTHKHHNAGRSAVPKNRRIASGRVDSESQTAHPAADRHPRGADRAAPIGLAVSLSPSEPGRFASPREPQ